MTITFISRRDLFEVMVVDKVLRMSKLVVLMVWVVNMVVRVMLTLRKVTMINHIQHDW